MTRRRLVALVAALVLFATVLMVTMRALSDAPRTAISATASSDAPSDEQPLKRVTQASKGSWEAACRDDQCIALVLFRLPVTIPATTTVDAVLSVTLDYKTTRGDAGSVGAGYMLEGEKGVRRMRPGSFRISSPSPRVLTTSTLTWVKDGLEGGRTYTFVVGLTSRDLGRSSPEIVAGTKAVAVLEIWADAR